VKTASKMKFRRGKFQKNISDVQEKNFSIIRYFGHEQKVSVF